MVNRRNEKIIMVVGITVIALLAALIILLSVKESSIGNVDEERRQSLIQQVENVDVSVWDKSDAEEIKTLETYVKGRLEKAKSDEEIAEILNLYNREISSIPDHAAKDLVFQENLEKVQNAGDENDQKDIKYIINTEKQNFKIETTEDMESFFLRIANRFYEARGKKLKVPTAEQIEKAAVSKTADHTIK